MIEITRIVFYDFAWLLANQLPPRNLFGRQEARKVEREKSKKHGSRDVVKNCRSLLFLVGLGDYHWSINYSRTFLTC